MTKRFLVAVLSLACISTYAGERSLDRQQLAQEVDELFAARSVDDTTPGCAVGVIERGEWALLESYGIANLEHGIPISSSSIFRTGSLAKQFTATAIALLAEEGMALEPNARAHFQRMTERRQREA